jgi:predicted ATPase
VSGVTAGLVADQLPRALRLVYRGRRVLRGIERPEEVWELGSANDPRFARPVTRPTGASALPTALTRLVGRGEDLTRLGQLLDAHRLVTLTGPGGTGKSRLAVEFAHGLAGRGVAVWYAALAPLRDSEPLVDVVARALGAELGPDPVAMLQRRAEQLHGVLVLDNCEHLLDECGALVERLLVCGPELRVLATSRESLGVDGEQVWPVAPLGIPAGSVRNRRQLAAVQASELESVELLLDRARALRPDLEVGDDEVAAVVRICRALDGIPLAIELAAGRLRSLSLQTLADRLDDQVRVLARSRPSRPGSQRHQSLRIALDWSYDLLTRDQQQLARGLSVFSGGFRLDAVDGVLGHDDDPLDGVDALVAKSLVTFDSSTARYHLLEPIRQYLSQRLEAAGEVDEMCRAHAYWVATLCARLGRRLLEDMRTIGSRLDEESSNIDLALRWGCEHDIAVAARIVGVLSAYWFSHDQASGRRWCGPVLAASTGLDDRTRARVLVTAGVVAQNDRDWEGSVRHLRAALAVSRAERLPAGQAWSLFWLGRALLAEELTDADGRLDPAQCFEEALELFTQLGNAIGVSSCRLWLGMCAFYAGELDRSEQLANQVIHDCLATGIRWPLGQAWSNLALIVRRRGDDDTALALLRDAADAYRDQGDPWPLAATLAELAAQQTRMGLDGALQDLAESVRLVEQVGTLPGRQLTLGVAAYIHLASGRPAMAAAALGASDATSHTLIDWGAGRAVAPAHADWLTQHLHETRAALDPIAVATAAASARQRPIEAVIDELIVQPASARMTGSGSR